MKLNLTKDWFLAAADREGDHEVGAGFVAVDPVLVTSSVREPIENARTEATHIAFGRLVQLMRRQRALSVERLADQARIDAEEVLLIESKPEYRPDVRTVHQLAQAFEMKPKALMQLAGTTETREEVFREALKFAASSEPIEKLTREETVAVEHFVAALNRLADEDRKVP